jgi:hypothetical protein
LAPAVVETQDVQIQRNPLFRGAQNGQAFTPQVKHTYFSPSFHRLVSSNTSLCWRNLVDVYARFKIVSPFH